MAPPYTNDQYRSPNIGTIKDLLVERGRARAQAALQSGQAQARAAEIGGQAWAGALRNPGKAIAGGIQQLMDPRVRLEALTLQGAQHLQAGRQAQATMLRGDQLPAGATGPRQESFLDSTGLFDVSKITQALGTAGFGDLAPDLVKGAEQINDSILKHQQLEEKTAQAHALLLGDLADGAVKLAKTGTPLLNAMDFVVTPALATKRITPQDYAQVRSAISELSPDQQMQALTTLMDQAAKLGGGETLGKDQQRLDRYGRVIASNIVPEKPTRASLAADLSSPDPIVRQRAKTAIDSYTAVPKRTDAELELDAYAKFIGKAKAEDLTYPERQQFAANKATITSNQAFQQHMRERQYDIAHPVPEKAKSQDALEQEYRVVLQRGMSSRSGGIGLEDAKVQQANHLLALFEQSYDAKTDTYNIPRVQQAELALGLARLLSPTGQVGIQLEKELNQRTALGDLNGALTYITGTPVTGSTQAIF